MPKEIISSEPVICPNLNADRRQRLLQALVKTYRDGTTEVLCARKEVKGDAGICQISKKPCDFETHVTATDAKQANTPLPKNHPMEIDEKNSTPGEISRKEFLKLKQDEIEKSFMVHALQKTEGNINQAAKLLQISLKRLTIKMKEFGLSGKADGKQMKATT